MNRRAHPLILAAIALVGCGDRGDRAAEAPPPKPELFGEGPRFRPEPTGSAVKHARPIHGMRCERRERPRYLAHLETFIGGRVVLMPRGIGRGARCHYPLRTREPTGLIEIERGSRATLGDLFDVWGQPLTRNRVLSFRGRVRAYVGRRLADGDPRTIELRPHAVVTLEVGRYVRPHANYVFPPG